MYIFLKVFTAITEGLFCNITAQYEKDKVHAHGVGLYAVTILFHLFLLTKKADTLNYCLCLLKVKHDINENALRENRFFFVILGITEKSV